MEGLEQENRELREEVVTLRSGVERLTALVETLMAAQNQNQNQVPPPFNAQAQGQPQGQATMISEMVSTTIPVNPTAAATQQLMPKGYPWGMPEGYLSAPEMTRPMTPIMVHTRPVVHTGPFVPEPIYHNDAPSESVGIYDRMDGFQDQFEELQKEMKALRGKELFGKNVHDLCLVPNVKVPAKFKLPEFEKYKGNSCPQAHLVMYVRKMSTHTDDQRLLIHYFQDSLTGAASKWYMGLDSTHIRTFNDLAEAFVKQYKYNVDMAPDRDQLRAMMQKEKESFKEYAQRWREVAAQVIPPMEEKEMTKIFLKTLGPFYYERMIASAPVDFTEMVGMGVRLEEAVREGRLVQGESSSGNARRYGSSFQKKKESDANAVSHGRNSRSGRGARYQPQQVASVTPFVNSTPVAPVNQQPARRNSYPRVSYDPIPMTYTELYPALIHKNLVQTRSPPPVPEKLPWWYKADATCAFHQNAPGHSLEDCWPLKAEVQRLVRSGMLSFRDVGPNVKNNPLPSHEAPAVNMVYGCPGKYKIYRVEHIRGSLVEMHATLCEYSHYEHNHAACRICSVNSRGCYIVRRDLQEMMDQGLIEILRDRDEGDVNVIEPYFEIPECVEVGYYGKAAVEPLVICLPGAVPYSSDRAVPYRYNATMLEGGKEVVIKPLSSVENIADVSGMTRSGRVFTQPQTVVDARKKPVQVPVTIGDEKRVNEGSSSGKEMDEILKLIKMSDYKVVDQLHRTPYKISIMELLTSSPAHRDSLMKILDQAFVDHDVTLDQFNGVVGNITACNNLSFSDEDLPEEGRNHNLALHISVSCKEDSMSNVLIDTGSSLNVMPKSTLAKLSYGGTPMRYSNVLVKAFDGSKKSVIGEVDLPIWVGPFVFQITFQVMDIFPAYSCLLGRPWIHEAGAVTSTLHQKLKFVRNGKLVVVNGERALLISHLSSFRAIEADEATIGTAFQALSVDNESKKNKASIASFKDAQQVVQKGPSGVWGQMVSLPENKNRAGLGLSLSGKSIVKSESAFRPYQEIFRSAGFLHPTPPEVDAIIGDEPEPEMPNFVTHGKMIKNWITVDVPECTHVSK
ncbi:uncharacterized protein LOC131630634 [Vicia villosa]|uniref:uncharacterized protein LOC131630634 n=1 Tax=Vicia villosa TaxID=3911 RepID=UPI00273C1CEE|nr:uncharacterized protein LOC131630634 [Vicia villosa]